ncbi:lipopolysaccharide biosynthesis protein [Macrococcus equi]|uniref:lipopolysaccharide biosynthesis protein n=1 Tax=Macrococcus equi TaxID=3395462 RepID=UPI0039BE7A81
MKKQAGLKKNGLMMLGSSVISQILLVLSVPFIGRLYSPEEYGLFTLFSNIAFLFIPIINGRYELLIINAIDKKEAYIFSRLSVVISIILLIIILPFTLVYFYISEKPLIFLIYLLVILILVSANNIATSYYSYKNRYDIVAYINFLRNLLLILFQLAFGFYNFGEIGLILGFVLSYFSGVIFSFKTWKDLSEIKNVDKNELKEKFDENIDQIKYSSTSIIVNTLSMSAVVFVIDYLYSNSDVGFYGMSLRVLNIPITIISLSLSKLFMQEANKLLMETGTFKKILQKFSLILIIVSFCFFGPLYFIPKRFISIVLGEQWIDIIFILKILIPMYVIRLVVTTTSLSFVILKKQKLELLLQCLFLIAIIIVGLMAYIVKLNFDSFIISFSMSFIICYLIYYYYMYKNA